MSDDADTDVRPFTMEGALIDAHSRVSCLLLAFPEILVRHEDSDELYGLQLMLEDLKRDLERSMGYNPRNAIGESQDSTGAGGAAP